MLRFPNPGSDIDSFIRIFRVLHEELGDAASFSLDDISAVLIRRNLASSSGYMGVEALARSYNEDRSRDRLYNQSKMYAELYRSLGWFHTSPTSRLLYSISYFGDHVVQATQDPSAIFRESILGIAYPSPVIDLRGEHQVRPFATILRTIAELDGLLCRDEMIVGPMCMRNDRDPREWDRMLRRLRATRGKPKVLQEWIREVSEGREITENTMGNYTRFPLAVLEWTGWTTKIRTSDPYPGRSMVFHRLMDGGARTVEWVARSRDIRTDDLSRLEPAVTSSLSRVAFFQSLNRAGYDISPVEREYQHDVAILQRNWTYKDETLLFSPFQQLDARTVQSYFSTFSEPRNRDIASVAKAQEVARGNGKAERTLTKVTFAQRADREQQEDAREPIAQMILKTHHRHRGNIAAAVEELFAHFQGANKDEFYPLVVSLFRVIGFPCELSRHGINYQRWDAIIPSETRSIPIEIKSPGEEAFISVKGVRQALENKVILLSRKLYSTSAEVTSLLVGYNVPNDRSEVNALVEDILAVFGFRIGIVDFRSLLTMATTCLVSARTVDQEKIMHLTGIVDVENPAPARH